ncbi:MAG: hypothetical protein ACM3O6_12430 [Acidobacteriota bacterium]
MIRVALAIAWREARLVAYRCAAISATVSRNPHRVVDPGDTSATPPRRTVYAHRLDADQRAEVAADAEALARAMLNAEGRR